MGECEEGSSSVFSSTYKIPTSPLDVLNIEPREEPLISKYWMPGVCGLLGLTGTIFTNWAVKRPVFSGLQRHVAITVAGVAIGLWLDKYRRQYLADRDAMIRHYVELHPEDFPPFERKKYSELFQPWIPIR